MEQLSAASSRVVELEKELQMAANDSAKVPYSSIFHDRKRLKVSESHISPSCSFIFHICFLADLCTGRPAAARDGSLAASDKHDLGPT